MRVLSGPWLVLAVACSPAPRPTPEVMPEVAARFVQVFNDHDAAGMQALTGAARRAEGVTADEVAWLSAQLGACGAPAFMWSFRHRGARFTSPCERGALEVALELDAGGEVVEVEAGAAGVSAPARLTDAAVAVLASLPDHAATPRPFTHNFDWSGVRDLGRCQLVRPWTVRARSAVFHAECEREAALLSLRVDADGQIAYAAMVPSARVYRGPAVGPA